MAKGNKWGDWQIIHEISSGGQGSVFKVKDSNGQLGALKRLKNPKRLDRFKAEVEVVAQLKHENIVPLIEANTTSEPYYAVFQYEPGASLDSIKDQLSSIPLAQRLRWCEDIATALAAAHQSGFVHRDVKPENILLSENHESARLCDFGLVYMEDDERVTASMEQVGSRYYIPPECEDGRADTVSSKSDLYSLGKVLYFLVSGGSIFAREQHRKEKYELSAVLDNPCLESISRILDCTVIEDVEKRIDSANNFLEMLSMARDKIERNLPIAGVIDTYRCIFCGVGTYKEVAVTGDTHAHNQGYGNEGNVGGNDMVFVECETCGNCQRFKLRHGKERWFPESFRKSQERIYGRGSTRQVIY